MMKQTQPAFSYLLRLGVVCAVTMTVEAQSMNQYNVIWDSPSEDYNGSMPIGNGDLAANVWVEPSGDLIFLVSKSDAWSG